MSTTTVPGRHPLSPDEELVAIFKAIPAKDLAEQLAAKFWEAHESDRARLEGEACIYGIDGYAELIEFAARLSALDPDAFVRRFYQMSDIDLLELDGVDAHAVARVVLDAVRGDVSR